jgi:hypothetical protein
MTEKLALTYRDSDGVKRNLDGCNLTTDKRGRYWLWSEQLKRNLAYQADSRESALISAISSLLFLLSLQNKEITRLRKIEALAQAFAETINPPGSDDE